ncbi:fumarylacetoacetate hydrolase family protein [Streptomyces ipomoeae]|uniref:fumarylacetoacetate hydrolase family protein n=1 Tax=Streptomyces ipomoeae TaxID=103232 RepID=UPI0015F0AC54|nr:fumarylacetoacetate hydrolase family protein [Streptomyces ipomoeae]MDX2937779.1 fumarylacetoacetate hydrolase family protein [Streptomyces ipomoeae]
MRLTRLKDWGTGLVVPDHGPSPVVIDVAESTAVLADSHPDEAELLRRLGGSGPQDWRALIENWGGARPALETLRDVWAADPQRFEKCAVPYPDLDAPPPPLISPTARLFAAGANFPDHASRALTKATGKEVTAESLLAEKEKGLPPWGFTVLPGTVIGDRAQVVPPTGVQKLDYEGEVAAVLATGGRRLEPDDIRFWAVAPFCDFSIRDPFLGIGGPIDRGVLVWALAKNFDTGNAFGPWLTTVDEGIDVTDLALECAVNGEVRQSTTTAGMIYGFAEIAAYLSRYVELHPGDIILSGTGAGTAVEDGVQGRFLSPGDEVSVRVRGGGVLTTSVGSPAPEAP